MSKPRDQRAPNLAIEVRDCADCGQSFKIETQSTQTRCMGCWQARRDYFRITGKATLDAG